jgi:hypothetical protein
MRHGDMHAGNTTVWPHNTRPSGYIAVCPVHLDADKSASHASGSDQGDQGAIFQHNPFLLTAMPHRQRRRDGTLLGQIQRAHLVGL